MELSEKLLERHWICSYRGGRGVVRIDFTLPVDIVSVETRLVSGLIAPGWVLKSTNQRIPPREG